MAFFSYAKTPSFERARFNMRKQKAGKTAESFIRALQKLSIQCDYGVLKDELIRDRIVADIYNKELS